MMKRQIAQTGPSTRSRNAVSPAVDASHPRGTQPQPHAIPALSDRPTQTSSEAAKSQPVLKDTAMGLPAPSLLLPKLPGAAAHWRLELFCKSADQLATLCTFFTANGITRVNIPNKQPEDDLLGTTQKLRSLGIDVCVHYSFKQQYKQTVEHSASRFSAFCSALPDEVDVSLV